MDLIINSKTLLNMLKIISGNLLTKKQDIFSYILIKKIKNKLFCISINDEIEIVTTSQIDAQDEKNIDFIIKYELIYNICKCTNDDTNIILKKTNNSIEIKTNNGIFNIPLLYNTDFPSFKDEKTILITIKVSSSEIKSLLYYPYMTTSEKNQNFFFNGILLDINKNSINAIASDGIKTSISQILTLTNLNTRLKIIIPRTIIKEFINTYKENMQTLVIITENYIKLINNQTTITAKLIHDTYEQINTKISSIITTLSVINIKELKKALITLNPICYDKVLALNIKKDKIILTAKNKSEYGIITIKAKSIGMETNINLSYNHITHILKITNSEHIYIYINTMQQNVIFKEKCINCAYIITQIQN